MSSAMKLSPIHRVSQQVASHSVGISSSVHFRSIQPPAQNNFPRKTFASHTAASRFDHHTDVLIVGSGAAALVAALRAHSHGLRPLIVEKTSKVGGSTAYSGGGVWIPNNVISQAAGVQDTLEDALQYLEVTIGDLPSSTRARKMAFLEHGPRMVSFLRDLGFQWRWTGPYPDYYPWELGSKADGGRCIEPQIFDEKALGVYWRDRVNHNPAPIPPMYLSEGTRITRLGASWGDFTVAAGVMLRGLLYRLGGQRPVLGGLALIGRLLALNLQHNTSIWVDSPLIDLVTDDNGAVVGAVVEREGLPQTVRATRGVLLAAGGFAHNRRMRAEYMPAPASTRWTSASRGDMGDAILAGVRAGAQTSLLDDAWWGPAMIDPQDGSSMVFAIFERSRPFSIIVDASGRRFMNEAQSYSDAGQKIYQHHQDVGAIPAWLVMDWNHRKRYMFGTMLPRQENPASLASGVYFKADTIESLASQIQVDHDTLGTTISRFNAQCRNGVDVDFDRGSNTYDHFFGDPKIGPNPNMGPIEQGPFYACKIWPGDLGTKGGLLTDEFARVVRPDGNVLEGLYAAGNTSASVMGRRYAGAGATIGPAMTFAYIAMDHVSKRPTTSVTDAAHLSHRELP